MNDFLNQCKTYDLYILFLQVRIAGCENDENVSHLGENADNLGYQASGW